MTKQSGYIVNIKAFIPSPKNDFGKQAAAATAMQEITTAKALPANFAEIATILDISGKYGSADIPDAQPVEQKPDPEAEEKARLAAEETARLAALGNQSPEPDKKKKGAAAE